MTRQNRAFTLMELLVVVAIIALLVGLVIVSMRTVRASASRSKSLSALRQMAMGYARYSEDNAGRLMPGYIDVNILVSAPAFQRMLPDSLDGRTVVEGDSQSYVWRLAPYLGNAWETFFVDTHDRGALASATAAVDCWVYGADSSRNPDCDPLPPNTVFVDERPTFGMNSIFVGGDSHHGGQYAESHSPWNTLGNEPIAATRLSEVKNPSRLIVFGPAAEASNTETYDRPEIGYCELRPPYIEFNGSSWIGPQWMVGEYGLVFKTGYLSPASRAGLPIDRNGKDLMPVAHLDGSTVVEQFSALSRDMRHWSPFEVSQHATEDPNP